MGNLTLKSPLVMALLAVAVVAIGYLGYSIVGGGSGAPVKATGTRTISDEEATNEKIAEQNGKKPTASSD